jgi:hypothetical protein
VTVQDEEFAWMREYLGGPAGIRTVACVTLAQELLQWTGRDTPYHLRQRKAIEDQWPALYESTLERLEAAIDGVKLKGFFAGDVFEHIEHAPPESVCISFPPTYKAGYEKLYARLESVFDWRSPSYEVFDDDGFDRLTALMREKWAWVTLRDYAVTDLSEHLISVVQTGMRSRPVFVYAGSGATRVVLPRQSTQDVPIARAEGELACEKLEVAQLTQGQMNTLRSEYLSMKIVPAGALVNLAVLCDGKLIGACAFNRPNYGGDGCYLMSDFAISGTAHKRLSKLILAAVLSEEVTAIVEQALNRRVTGAVTTAFTDKPKSMKYQGIFDLQKRGEGFLQYAAKMPRWTLAEGLDWWRQKHMSA